MSHFTYDSHWYHLPVMTIKEIIDIRLHPQSGAAPWRVSLSLCVTFAWLIVGKHDVIHKHPMLPEDK